jgi:hypothetical protein
LFIKLIVAEILLKALKRPTSKVYRFSLSPPAPPKGSDATTNFRML